MLLQKFHFIRHSCLIHFHNFFLPKNVYHFLNINFYISKKTNVLFKNNNIGYNLFLKGIYFFKSMNRSREQISWPCLKKNVFATFIPFLIESPNLYAGCYDACLYVKLTIVSAPLNTDFK